MKRNYLFPVALVIIFLCFSIKTITADDKIASIVPSSLIGFWKFDKKTLGDTEGIYVGSDYIEWESDNVFKVTSITQDDDLTTIYSVDTEHVEHDVCFSLKSSESAVITHNGNSREVHANRFPSDPNMQRIPVSKYRNIIRGKWFDGISIHEPLSLKKDQLTFQGQTWSICWMGTLSGKHKALIHSGDEYRTLIITPVEPNLLKVVSGNYETTYQPFPKKTSDYKIYGDWFRTDGSNEWAFSIYPDKLICPDSRPTDYQLSRKGRKYRIDFRQNGKSSRIEIRTLKDSTLKAGIDNSSEKIYCRKRTYVEHFIIPDDENFTKTVFTKDSAWLHGYIRHEKLNLSAEIVVDNVLTNDVNSYPIEIESDGYFSVKIPLLYPTQTLFAIKNIEQKYSLLLEPGKDLFVSLNLNDYQKEFLFSGRSARVNSDLNDLQDKGIQRVLPFSRYKKFLKENEYSATKYKNWQLNLLEKELAKFEKVVSGNPISLKAKTVYKNNLLLYRYQEILDLEFSSDRIKQEQAQETKVFDDFSVFGEPFGEPFYSFLDTAMINNPTSLVSGKYPALINRITTASFINQEFTPKSIVQFADSLLTHPYSITSEESTFLHKIKGMNTTGNPSVILSIKDFGLWDRINKKFEQELHLFSEEEHLHWLLSQYEDYFGIRKGFARDILLSLYYKQAIGKKNKKFWSEEFSLLN
ncbi:MAG: hypothetical protein ACK5KP_07310, partial [Paludibacteraceae bacterium]